MKDAAISSEEFTNLDRYDTIMNMIQEGIMFFDQEGTLIEINKTAEKMFGLLREEVLHNITFHTICDGAWRIDGTAIPPDELPCHIALQTGKPQYNITIGFEQKNKEKVWILFNAYPLQSKNEQKPHGVLVSFVDITSYVESLKNLEVRKILAQEHAAELQRYKLAVDNVMMHVVITDKEGIIIYANKQVTLTTGYSQTEIIGKKAGKMWGGLMGTKFYTYLWHIIKHKKRAFRGDVQNKRKNGELYDARVFISPVLDNDSNVKYFVGIEEDITKQKEVDRMKTEFISLASHQLRTPLTAIKWNLDMLLAGDVGDVSAKQRHMMEQVAASNQRMIDLVSALLDVSHLETGKIVFEKEELDLKQLLENTTFPDLQDKIEQKDIQFTFHIDDTPHIYTDKKLLCQVYTNLLTNAIKYTPEGGTVSLVIKIEDKVLLSEVKDTGMGIPEKEQEHIFSRFYRGSNIRTVDTSGNGLGLYLVKSIVEAMKGDVWFTSKEGKGTSFFFTIPFHYHT